MPHTRHCTASIARTHTRTHTCTRAHTGAALHGSPLATPRPARHPHLSASRQAARGHLGRHSTAGAGTAAAAAAGVEYSYMDIDWRCWELGLGFIHANCIPARQQHQHLCGSSFTNTIATAAAPAPVQLQQQPSQAPLCLASPPCRYPLTQQLDECAVSIDERLLADRCRALTPRWVLLPPCLSLQHTDMKCIVHTGPSPRLSHGPHIYIHQFINSVHICGLGAIGCINTGPLGSGLHLWQQPAVRAVHVHSSIHAPAAPCAAAPSLHPAAAQAPWHQPRPPPWRAAAAARGCVCVHVCSSSGWRCLDPHSASTSSSTTIAPSTQQPAARPTTLVALPHPAPAPAPASIHLAPPCPPQPTLLRAPSNHLQHPAAPWPAHTLNCTSLTLPTPQSRTLHPAPLTPYPRATSPDRKSVV